MALAQLNNGSPKTSHLCYETTNLWRSKKIYLKHEQSKVQAAKKS